jgi:hypothetical protein
VALLDVNCACRINLPLSSVGAPRSSYVHVYRQLTQLEGNLLNLIDTAIDSLRVLV